MKTFDFNHKSFQKHSPAVQAFLRKAFHSGMSKQAFIAAYKQLPRPTKDGKLKSKKGRRSPSVLRQRYDNLRSKFNFF